MPRRPKITAKRVTRAQVKGYSYVRPNPGVRAIAAINGKGAYRKARGAKSARSSMSGLSAGQRRLRAAAAVSKATRPDRRTTQGNTTMARRRLRMNRKRRSAWAGTKQVSVRIPRSNAHQSRYPFASRTGNAYTRKVSFRVPSDEATPISLMAKNRRRRRKAARRRVVGRKRVSAATRAKISRGVKRAARLKMNKRRRPVRRRRAAAKRRSPVRRRRVLVRNKRRSPVRRRRVVRRRKSPVRRRRVLARNKRRSPVRRRRVVRRRKSPVRRRRVLARNKRRSPVRRRRASKGFLRKNAGAMKWVKTGMLITTGVITHKLLTGMLKNLLVAKNPTPAADPAVDAQVAEQTPASGLGFLPASLTPYAGIISGAITAAAGVYLTTRVVKTPETRQMIAGGMVASFLHTVIVDLLNKSAPEFAASVSGLGAVDGNAARLSAMYGLGTSIQPMYADINGVGEYFSSGLGSAAYEAAAGTGEYFSSGVGEYFSSGLGEYGGNPDMMQAAAGYGAVDAGSNTNHLDPSSNLDRELSIAEAAAGVGSLPYEAAAGLGSTVSTVPSSQTWIPGESDAPIWAGVRPVDRSQAATAMIPAGTLQSGGGQGIFG